MQMIYPTPYGGVNTQVGEFLVNRLMPGREIQSVGPIVFLDHIYPKKMAAVGEMMPSGDFAHPHRGIATFSYVFSGKLTHYDSRGHKSTIGAGGVQWMKAGNGIIHDEQPFTDGHPDNIFHSLQYWINLPSAVKAEDPAYYALQAEEVPEVMLPAGAGCLRVLLGECGAVASPIPVFGQEFIYHIRLTPRSRFTLMQREGMEYAAFVPDEEMMINGQPLAKSKIVIFEKSTGSIQLENSNVSVADVLIFGGRPYSESIVAEGPFVMNSRAEIAAAYRDFFDGKYGEIQYNLTTVN